jgi:hypothetical protein
VIFFFLLKRDMQPEKVRVHFCVDVMVKIIKGKRVIDYNELYPFDIANSKGSLRLLKLLKKNSAYPRNLLTNLKKNIRCITFFKL